MLRLAVLFASLLGTCARGATEVLEHGFAMGPPPPTTPIIVTVRDHQGFELPYVGVTVAGAGVHGRDLSGRTDSRGEARFFVVPGRAYVLSTNLGGFTDIAVNGPTTVEVRTKKRSEPQGIF